MFSQKELAELALTLTKAQHIVITTHRNPDADAMGSSLGLMHLLRQNCEADIQVIVPDPFPDFLSWMPGAGETIFFDAEQQTAGNLIEEADVIFCLDYNHPSRTDKMENSLLKAKAVMVMIDHHQDPDSFAKYRWSDTGASSTCEMIVWFMDAMGFQESLNKTIATCLYTGIMTDTGSFRFSSTSSQTHTTISRLMEKGIEHWKIHEAIFNQNTFEKLKLWGYAFQNKLVILPELKTAYIYLSADELSSFSFQEGDLEGIVNYALSIRGVCLGVLFTERNNKIRISFRSVGSFAVNKFAKAHFHGGGHSNAAGGVSDSKLEDTVKHFQHVLAEYSEDLNRQ